jgi:hypothetical protein
MSQKLREYVPALKYGAKILPSEILGGGMTVFGNVWYVDPTNGSDSNTGDMPDKAFASIQAAHDAAATNNHDIIYLSGYAAHAQTSMLNISKNRLHIFGTGVGFRKYGQRSRITMGVTTATSDAFMFKNTGIGNTFANIKFDNGNTLTQNVAAVGEGGEYASYINCEMYDSTRLDSDTHAEMVLNGDSAQFYGCTIGSLADSVSGNKIRPAVLLTAATVAAGKVSRDVLFDECRFWKNAGGTATAFIKGAATDVERVMEFHNCGFIANVLGSAPAVAIDVATLTVGQILLTGDTFSAECTKIATATGVFSSLPARVATATIGIQTT